MPDVFISYKQEERDAVRIIADALTALKLDVWFDTRLRAGGSFDEEIAAALRAAKAVLVCWSPAALASEWVRGEATDGLKNNRLAACFLQPTDLIPPFNLTHAENLAAWAGQPDDPAWIKVLERIGELVNRPGLSTYHSVMRPGASVQEMEAWANAHGEDALVDAVWERIALLKGEDGAARLAREKAEARVAGEKPREQAEKARRLVRERGLRDPARERRRFMALAASVGLIAVVAVGAIIYFNDAQARDLKLRDRVATTEQARAFLSQNAWHPIAGRAREKLTSLDNSLWLQSQNDGSIEALQAYIADAEHAPQGAHIAEARVMLSQAERVQRVQTMLSRMRLYRGAINGARDAATREAVMLFRYRWNMTVNDEVDDALIAKLDEALMWWTHPRLEDLRATTVDPPSEADYIRISRDLGVDTASLTAAIQVESGRLGGFSPDGRPIVLFEPHLFSRYTQHRYDRDHPTISFERARQRPYPPTPEGRWAQLAEAYALDPDAALRATSFGSMQILGDRYRECGFETVGEFVRALSESQAAQLEATLLGYVRSQGFVEALQRHDWTAFAARYNGRPFAERYGQLMRAIFERESARIAALHAPYTPGAPPAAPEAEPAAQ